MGGKVLRKDKIELIWKGGGMRGEGEILSGIFY